MIDRNERPFIFLTPKAVETASKAGVLAIGSATDALLGLEQYTLTQTGRGLPAAPDKLGLLIWDATRPVFRWDKHYVDAHARDGYTSAYELMKPASRRNLTTKQAIVNEGLHVLEVQVFDFRAASFAGALARSIIAQNPEDSRLLAPGQAWRDQIASLPTKGGMFAGLSPKTSDLLAPFEQHANQHFSAALLPTRLPELSS